MSVAQQVASFAAELNTSPLGSIGLVIGATVKLAEYGIEKISLDSTAILSPGFGHQGAKLSDVKSLFGDLSRNVVCSVSRSIAGDSEAGLTDRLEMFVSELKEAMA
jgi:orotidine-5'-phosphate decarboxylase